MERLPNRYPKIRRLHGTPLYKGLSLFYPKLQKYFVFQTITTKNMHWNGIKNSLSTPFPNSSKRDNRRRRVGDVGVITILVLFCCNTF